MFAAKKGWAIVGGGRMHKLQAGPRRSSQEKKGAFQMTCSAGKIARKRLGQTVRLAQWGEKKRKKTTLTEKKARKKKTTGWPVKKQKGRKKNEKQDGGGAGPGGLRKRTWLGIGKKKKKGKVARAHS